MIEILKEDEEKVINCGAFNYSAGKIASLLGLEKEEVADELRNEESLLFKLYQRGKDMADYAIDLKLFELSRAGDLKALEQFNKRKKISR